MILLEVTVFHMVFAGIFMFLIAIAWLLAEFKGMKDEIRERMGIQNDTIKLRLQAYERHRRLIEELKTEFEYNVSQQIYVSKEVFNAVTKLKDQNIYIINQLAATLPHQASSLELIKHILEYSMTEKAELNTIVLDALQYEAKKIF